MTDIPQEIVEALAKLKAERFAARINAASADLLWGLWSQFIKEANDELTAVYPLITAAENEACAAVADSNAHAECEVAEVIASAIRARMTA